MKIKRNRWISNRSVRIVAAALLLACFYFPGVGEEEASGSMLSVQGPFCRYCDTQDFEGDPWHVFEHGSDSGWCEDEDDCHDVLWLPEACNDVHGACTPQVDLRDERVPLPAAIGDAVERGDIDGFQGVLVGHREFVRFAPEAEAVQVLSACSPGVVVAHFPVTGGLLSAAVAELGE